MSLCLGHQKGYAPSQPRKYFATCPRCVALRGHLPEAERDRPAEQPRIGYMNHASAAERAATAAHPARVAALEAARARAASSASQHKPECSWLLFKLPRRACDCGADAARRLPYETPTVTPVGNMLDLLASCGGPPTPEPPSRRGRPGRRGRPRS